MDYKNIQTSKKMNEVVKEQLIFRDDHLSKYAAKRIEELEQLLIHSVLNCLPSKEETKQQLENYNKKYADSHDKKTNDAYNIGFRHCFHFINDWVNGIRQIV